MSYRVLETQGTEVKMIGERALRSHHHDHTEWTQTHTHQFHNSGKEGEREGGSERGSEGMRE